MTSKLLFFLSENAEVDMLMPEGTVENFLVLLAVFRTLVSKGDVIDLTTKSKRKKNRKTKFRKVSMSNIPVFFFFLTSDQGYEFHVNHQHIISRN